jgi:O-antigen/teichoic acid export membrane protein
MLAVLVWLLFTRERLPGDKATELPALQPLDSFSRALYAFNLFSWILATSDRYLIDSFRSAQEVGIYVLNYGLWSIPFTVLNGWIDSFSRPRLYTRASAGNWGQVVEVMRLKLMLAFGLSLLGAGALYFVGKPLSFALVGQRYWGGMDLLMLLVVAHVFFVTGHTASTVFIAAKKAQPLWITALLAAGLNVLLNIHYIPKYGIVAAAASTLAAYAFWTVLLLLFAFVLKSHLRTAIEKPA